MSTQAEVIDINYNALDIIRVMVVDDQRTMRSIIRGLLKDEGITDITEAADGAQALHLIENSETPPDVIICDLHMAGMDGLEFCQKVRLSKVEKVREVKIIILTGDSDSMMHDISSQVGALAVLSKPVSSTVLAAEIAKAVDIAM